MGRRAPGCGGDACRGGNRIHRHWGAALAAGSCAMALLSRSSVNSVGNAIAVLQTATDLERDASAFMISPLC